jgi:hypothetical protein
MPGSSFTPYSAGFKIYGGGRLFPTMGPVDKTGYRERDRLAKARRNAVLRRLKANQSGNFMSSNWLGGS